MRRTRGRTQDGVHVRMAARIARVHSSSRRVALWAGGTVLLAALLAWLLLFSPVLTARQVRVEGVPADSVAAVRERAAVPLGRPLLRIDTDAVRHRVLADGGLGDVRVSRSWPSTVLIRADRRVPVLVLKNPQGQLKVVDASGVAFATVKRAPKDLPLATVRPPEVAGGPAEHPGAQATRQGRSAVVSLVAALPEQLRHRMTDLTLTLPEEVSFRLGKVSVRWGSGSHAQEKLAVLRSLLGQSPVRRHGGTIDVSAPDSPVVRPS